MRAVLVPATPEESRVGLVLMTAMVSTIRPYKLNNLDDGKILAHFFQKVGIKNNLKKNDFAQFYFPSGTKMFSIGNKIMKICA